MTRTRNTILLCLVAATSLLCGLTPQAASAQNGFNLPHSQFGIGTSDLPFNMPAAVRTGGTVYTAGSINRINPFNPASYANITKESFIFDIGFNVQMCNLSDGRNFQRDADGNVGYLAFGLPLTGWWKIGAGLMPYTTMDYLTVIEQTSSDYGTMQTINEGTGGANLFFLGTAFNIPAGEGRTLQAGMNLNYINGKTVRLLSYSFPDNSETFYVNSRRAKELHVNNLLLEFGLQATQDLGHGYTLGIGLDYKPRQNMTANELAFIYTYASGSETIMDTVFPARGEDMTIKSRLSQANNFGLGLSIEKDHLLRLSADATFAAWQGLRYEEDPSHSIFGNVLSSTDTRFFSVALGFERLINMDADSYWGRIGWSIGAHSENGVANILAGPSAGESIDRWGVGAGLSLPMRKGRSVVNLSIGYEVLGRKDIVRREALTFGIAVSSCERWFVKRFYN